MSQTLVLDHRWGHGDLLPGSGWYGGPLIPSRRCGCSCLGMVRSTWFRPFLSPMGLGHPRQRTGDSGQLSSPLVACLVPRGLPSRNRTTIAPCIAPAAARLVSHGHASLAPPLVALGTLFCAGVMVRGGSRRPRQSHPKRHYSKSFPFVMMVAAIMLIVTGRTPQCPGPSSYRRDCWSQLSMSSSGCSTASDRIR